MSKAMETSEGDAKVKAEDVRKKRRARRLRVTIDHQARHITLHAGLDELLADYLEHHKGSLPSQVSVLTLGEWSNEQQQKPTP